MSAIQFIPALDALGFCRSAFLTRVPGIDCQTDRETALIRLRQAHAALLDQAGFSPPVIAEQVHGNEIAVLTKRPDSTIPTVDALATSTPGLCLGIYVADCAAVYFADPVRRVIALAHSGKKGTELSIVPRTIETLRENFGSQPTDLTVVVSPCIRPPDYEIDFAATIADQAKSAGVTNFHDPGENTAADLEKFYSYRV
ncbi:MAG: laccase domain-containing protein, partial [Chthoniobacterales bacterium]